MSNKIGSKNLKLDKEMLQTTYSLTTNYEQPTINYSHYGFKSWRG